MKNPRSQLYLYGLACLPALLLAIDFGRRAAQDRKQYDLPPERYAPPDDVIVPSSAAYELKGAELQTFLARRPLVPGVAAPRIDAIDFRNERLRIPAGDGKPTVWAVSDGSQDCAQVLHQLVDLHERLGGQLHIAAFVATHSEYVWGHHGGTFGHSALQVVHDPDGQYYRQMRPPGKDPTETPAVYACDGRGVIRYVAQPDPQAQPTWPAELQEALHLTTIGRSNRG